MAPLADLLGDSPGIQAVRDTIGRLMKRHVDARRLPPILILGETGTGKGLLARLIHRIGPRAAGPFVDVNCAAIPDTLLEAELFGFERGAFTDARQAKPGLFQAADHGTIFLDEVGLLPEGLQAKLLKVIEERAVRRLGSTRSEPVDAWILTATNEDLRAATHARRFREDLYHRLAVVTLGLPALRERGRDILLLAERFLARACADYRLPPKTFAPDAVAALLAYPWPGNVRELGNTIERVALLTDAALVTAVLLGLPEAPAPGPSAAAGPADGTSLDDAVRDHLVEILGQTSWNISRAAAVLGISRNTLRARIEKYGLRRGRAPRAMPRPPVAPAGAAAPRPASGAAVPAAPLRWERRRLTLLRAVLLGAPTLDVPAYGTRVPEVLVEKVQSFGGRVDELGPTGLVAVFGLEPVEDAPSRAALAAMAIQKAVERAGQGEGAPPAITLGIHVSHFLVGETGGGAQIDLDAKRAAWTVVEGLVAAAAPHQIAVSESAAAFLARRFELVPLGGPDPPAGPAFRLAGRSPGPAARLGHFVGRRHDLELLESRLGSAMRGHGQVVGIVGEAGIGKSRLLVEFRQRLAGAPLTYIEASCVSYGSAIPYLPVLDMVRANCGITDLDGAEAIVAKVHAALQHLDMDPAEWAPYLLALLGIKQAAGPETVLGPEAVQARTLETLRQMALKGSRRRPLVFAVEDLHWIDRTSEACLAALVESLAGAPILLLGTYRPGYRPPWMDRSYATQVALQPLSPEDSLSVVRAVLPARPATEALTQLICDKAEGNPFFLEELCRALGERGELAASLAVPDTIQEVLGARIARLGEAPRQVLQAAAVLGRAAPRRLLAAIWDGPGKLDPHLAELTRLEFLYEETGGPEPVHVFRHALTQEVAYESLPPVHRQTLHAAAGRALEAAYQSRLDEAYDRLAYHYARTEHVDKAVEYLARFAEKAARRHAHTEAVRALEEALSHVERVSPEARDRRVLDLRLRLAASLIPLGRFAESLELLQGEEPRLARLRDPTLTGHYYFLLGRTESFLGEHERAAESARRAIAEAERGGDESTLGKAYCLLALEAPLSGQGLVGIEHGRRAVALLERTGERWWLGPAHWVVGLNHAQLGDFASALDAHARAHAIGEAIGDRRIQTFAAWATGMVHAAKGDYAAGIEACQRGLDCSPDPLNTAIASGWLGYAHLEKGDPARARPLLEQSVQQLGEFRFGQFQGWFTVFLAEAHLATGAVERARELADHGLTMTRAAKFWYGTGWAERTLGRIARETGAFADAERYLAEALQTFEAIQARYELGRVHLDLAALARARARETAAATHLAAARALFAALGIPRYLARVEALAAAPGRPAPGPPD